MPAGQDRPGAKLVSEHDHFLALRGRLGFFRPPSSRGADLPNVTKITASVSIVLPLHELPNVPPLHDDVYHDLLTYVKRVLPRAEEYRVKGDGHCFFRVVAKMVFGSPDLFANVRQDVVNEVEANKERYQLFFRTVSRSSYGKLPF